MQTKLREGEREFHVWPVVPQWECTRGRSWVQVPMGARALLSFRLAGYGSDVEGAASDDDSEDSM